MRYIVFLIILLTDCSSPHEQNQEDIKEIETMSSQRADAFNNGDASGIAKYFSDDALLMAPNSNTLVGPVAVKGYYQSIFDEFETSLDSYYEEVEVSGNLAFGRGIANVELVHKTTGDTTYSTSKYLNILKKLDSGNWVTTHDIWNNTD